MGVRGTREALKIVTGIEKLPGAVELLRQAGRVQGCPQVRDVLVDIYAPGYQGLQTLVVTCTRKAETVSLCLTPARWHVAAGTSAPPPGPRPPGLSPLLAASCVGEGRQDSSWGLAPYSSRSAVQLALPCEQALNNGVTPSMVIALT